MKLLINGGDGEKDGSSSFDSAGLPRVTTEKNCRIFRNYRYDYLAQLWEKGNVLEESKKKVLTKMKENFKVIDSQSLKNNPMKMKVSLKKEGAYQDS